LADTFSQNRRGAIRDFKKQNSMAAANKDSIGTVQTTKSEAFKPNNRSKKALNTTKIQEALPEKAKPLFKGAN